MRVILLFVGHLIIGFANAQSVLVKVNVIRGEGFVTPLISSDRLKAVFEEGLNQRGYQTSLDRVSADSSFFVDVFVYQHPADLVRMTVTVRSREGIHYLDRQGIKLFADREAAFGQLANLIVKNFPIRFDRDQFFKITVSDLLVGVRTSYYGSLASSMTQAYQNKYCSSIEWAGNEGPFLIEGGLNLYFFYCANLQGLRKIVKKQPIKVHLRIGSRFAFEVVSIESSVSLAADQVSRIHEMVDAIPLWIVDAEFEGITLSICSE